MRGIAVLAIHSQDIKFGVGYVPDLNSADTRTAGTELARTTMMDFGQNRRGVFIILSDGLLRNSSSIIKGVQEIFGRVFPIIGAGSSDNFEYKESYQFFQDKPLRNSAAAVFIGGQMPMGVGHRHGWRPLGKPRMITEAKGNTIKTIDHKRASHLYEEYLGTDIGELKERHLSQSTILYPLGIYMKGEKEYLLRNPLSIQSDGSIACHGNIPEESEAEVHLMITNKDFCKEAARDAAHEVKEALSEREPKLIIVFESLARHKLLGRSCSQEIQAIREILGPTAPLLGMYSYSEIAPLKSSDFLGEAYLHNGSIVILAIA